MQQDLLILLFHLIFLFSELPSLNLPKEAPLIELATSINSGLSSKYLTCSKIAFLKFGA